MLVLLARTFRCNIWLQSGRHVVRVSEITPLVVLDARQGKTIKVSAEGADEGSAVRTIHRFLCDSEPTIDALKYRIRQGGEPAGESGFDPLNGAATWALGESPGQRPKPGRHH